MINDTLYHILIHLPITHPFRWRRCLELWVSSPTVLWGQWIVHLDQGPMRASIELWVLCGTLNRRKKRSRAVVERMGFRKYIGTLGILPPVW